MRKIKFLTCLLACLVCCGIIRANETRVKKNIDFDWYFHLGDMVDGEKNSVNYYSWQKLDVPHDWTIEAEYSKDHRRENGFLPGGIGWYKKDIEWDNAWTGKRVFIEFDGAYMNSTVWLNGEKVGYYPNGYLGFGYDITSFLKKGKNILSVRLDNSLLPSARWYAGTGIYRHVNLLIVNNIHVDRNGTYVTTPEVSKDKATVAIETAIFNNTGKYPVPVKIISVIVNKEGREVARGEKSVGIKYKKQTVCDTLTITNPKLWSPEMPDLYCLKTVIENEDKVVDNYETNFGVRKLEYNIAFGFKLNGISTKMKGVCLHQNMGALGSVMPEEIWARRLATLKAMGCNAIRTTHYPYAPEFYDLCDSMGFMVINEPWDGWFNWKWSHKAQYDYSYYFLDWWEQDLEEFIKRDRNHPSVVMWCLGNEVWGYDRYYDLQNKMNDIFHTLDPTRPTTQAYCLEIYLDIAGFNANGENMGDLADFHQKQPKKLAVGTEIPHTRQTRGVYRTIGEYNSWNAPEKWKDEERSKLFPVQSFTKEEVFTDFDPHYASCYDNQTRRISVREQWKQTRDNDWFVGQFMWTGFDYLGESWGWPGRTNNYGIIDLAGFPKDPYYLYQSLWTDKPMVHILPHWTHPGKEGVEIPMVVYTNGDAAELFLNGKSLGKKKIDKKDEMQIVWLVPYKAGTITAVAYNNKGKEIARKSEITASAPATVKLTADRKTIKANRRDYVYIVADILDAKGNFVPYANNEITFDVTGPYKLIGVENGDLIDVSPHKVLNRKAFMGKALLILQATDQQGKLVIRGTSPGLKQTEVSVSCE